MSPSRRLAALGLGLFQACASAGAPPALVPPAVTLVDLAVTEVGAQETTLALSLRCANENPEPLATVGGVFAVDLNGVRAGKALTNRALEIPRLGEARETVALRVDNRLFAAELQALRSATSLEYALESKLYLASGRGERVLISRQSGSLALSPAFGAALAPLSPLSTGTPEKP